MEQTRVTVVSAFSFRGALEEVSNTFTFNGAPPASPAGWDTLLNALLVELVKVLAPTVVVKRAYCYTTDDPHEANVYARDFTSGNVGTLVLTSGTIMDGNSAVWVRWKVARRSSKGRSIYLRKYFHPAVALTQSQGVAHDLVLSTQRNALLAFGTKLMDGSFADNRVLTAPGHTDTIVAREASTYVTDRQLRKGSRRPPP